MAVRGPTQVYDWPSTSGESSEVWSGSTNGNLATDENHIATTENMSVNNDVGNYENSISDSPLRPLNAMSGMNDPQQNNHRSPEYQQQLNVEDFLPNRSLEEKKDMLIDLKCAYMSKLAAEIFAYMHFESRKCKEIIAILLYALHTSAGMFFLLRDPLGTFRVLERFTYRTTTSIFILICYLKYLGSSLADPHRYLVDRSTNDVAAADIIHQLLSLSLKLHGIVRLQESLPILLQTFVGKDSFLFADVWHGFSFLCMVHSCVTCVDNFHGNIFIDVCGYTEYRTFVRYYDIHHQEVFTAVIRMRILSILLCIVSEGIRISQYVQADEQGSNSATSTQEQLTSTFFHRAIELYNESKETNLFVCLALL